MATSRVQNLRHKQGYRKTEGYITIPTMTNLIGLDLPLLEGAFNYFGLKVPDVLDVEFGLFTKWCKRKRWYVFRNYLKWTDKVTDDSKIWPPDGIPAGTKVFMRLWVPQDNQVKFYVSYVPYHTERVWIHIRL